MAERAALRRGLLVGLISGYASVTVCVPDPKNCLLQKLTATTKSHHAAAATVRLRDTLNPAMTPPTKIRGWKLLALLAAFVPVLLLVLPHATDHHATALFLLVPILLFIERIDRPVPYQPRTDHVIAPNHHVRSTLFQRPPPSQA